MKWFIKCFKQYADFNSRARRSEFWWFSLINFIIAMVLMVCWIAPIVKMGIDPGEIDDMELVRATLGSPFLYLYLLYYIAVLIPSIAGAPLARHRQVGVLVFPVSGRLAVRFDRQHVPGD